MQVLKRNSNLDERIERFRDSIFLNVGSSIKRIPLNSILYIKGMGDYMKVVCEDENHMVYIRMRTLEDVLPDQEFLRVHKSYMIRIDKIDRVFTSHVEINKETIPISRNCKDEVLRAIPWIK